MLMTLVIHQIYDEQNVRDSSIHYHHIDLLKFDLTEKFHGTAITYIAAFDSR